MFTYSYPRPAVTVDAILVSPRNSVLLIERGREPFKGKWALPGGFIDMDEELEIACQRELEEETGLKVGALKQFKAFGSVNRDPRHRTISVLFYAFTDDEFAIASTTRNISIVNEQPQAIILTNSTTLLSNTSLSILSTWKDYEDETRSLTPTTQWRSSIEGVISIQQNCEF